MNQRYKHTDNYSEQNTNDRTVEEITTNNSTKALASMIPSRPMLLTPERSDITPP
jgi:hypothetical protein